MKDTTITHTFILSEDRFHGPLAKEPRGPTAKWCMACQDWIYPIDPAVIEKYRPGILKLLAEGHDNA